jgi:hypothetical protein
MQPYVFPYVGYFHLIEATDRMVFFDDVAFRKRSWINRNRILLEGRDHLFTVPVSGASQNKLILDVQLAVDAGWRRKFMLTLRHAYGDAPHFGPVADLVETVLSGSHESAADLAIASIDGVYDLIGLPWEHVRSSACSPQTRGLDGPSRLIQIARDQGAEEYVNAVGGRNLYDADEFRAGGLELGFVESLPIEYDQLGGHPFVPGLSIIDLLMFNDVADVRHALTQFRVVP